MLVAVPLQQKSNNRIISSLVRVIFWYAIPTSVFIFNDFSFLVEITNNTAGLIKTTYSCYEDVTSTNYNHVN